MTKAKAFGTHFMPMHRNSRNSCVSRKKTFEWALEGEEDCLYWWARQSAYASAENQSVCSVSGEKIRGKGLLYRCMPLAVSTRLSKQYP